MNDFLFVIDGYLSNYQRVSACDELIVQLRSNFPEKKILLINKFNNSFGLESKVDYYFYFGDGFMVGPPPEEIIKDNRYCRPYVYFETNVGVLENWMPHVGVSDHVANVYNGFILSSRMAENLGYKKVFRIEYDMLFDEKELETIKDHLKKFETEDYLIYGRRKEGSWIPGYLSLIDLHFCGFSTKLVEGFDLVKNNSDYWLLCDKIKYWGKWCEYNMSMVFETNLNKAIGTEYPGFVREFFTKSHFDRISSSGLWENKWSDMPKICRITRDHGKTEDENEIMLFYWNENSENMKVEVTTDFGYSKEILLNRRCWSYDVIKVQDSMNFDCLIDNDGKKHNYKLNVRRGHLQELNTRFLFK